ncbi:hypothetical protein [Paenibacillus sp. JJ1722]
MSSDVNSLAEVESSFTPKIGCEFFLNGLGASGRGIQMELK